PRPPPFPSPPSHRLLRVKWSKAVCKGQQLLNAIRANDAAAGQLFNPPRSSMQSPFQGTQEELESWDYFLYDGVKQFGYDPSSGFWGCSRVLQDLHVSVPTVWEGGKNEVLVASHGDKLAHDDEGPIPFNEQHGYKRQLPNGQEKEYPVTGAYFVFAMNYDDGVIMAMSRKGARYAAPSNNVHVPDGEWPDIEQSSDVNWSLWNMRCRASGKDVSNIRYFLSLQIVNPLTQRLIMRVLTQDMNPPLALTVWPGVSYKMDTEKGQALLASPNGNGTAHMLIQHKRELGSKEIYGVTVFQGEGLLGEVPQLVFYIR
ncbi:hypothetical protein K491DRAFT_608146, partial [Lophiostoma macrostomum CBS 122681]